MRHIYSIKTMVDLLDLLDAVPPSACAPHLVGGTGWRSDENMRRDHGDCSPVHVSMPDSA